MPSSISSFAKHIHPVKIPLKALELKSTWALGGICMVLVTLLMGSGMLMIFSYQPFPELAYASVQTLENQYVFGRLIRSVHYFSANILILALFFHMLRVFFTGGFTGKRRGNWIVGMVILGFVLTACFTGYLLPWDQTAFWAVTICISMMDYIPAGGLFKDVLMPGGGISEKTLQLFFTLHTTVIPAFLIGFPVLHFWKVRKAKGVVTSGLNSVPPPVMVKTDPNLLLRELVASLMLVALVLVLATVFKAPLGDMANAGLSPNPAKAPWYFNGFQELLLHFHPVFAVFFIPLLVAGTLVRLPYKPWDTRNSGIWFISLQGKKAALASMMISLVLTPSLVLVDEYLLNFQAWLPHMPPVFTTGGLPFGLCLCLVFLFHMIMKKSLALSNSEAFQSTAVFLITAFVILTLICSRFRGAGMKLSVWGS